LAELGGPVQIEQDEFAAIRWKLGIQGRNDCARADGKVDDGLESQEWCKATQAFFPSKARDLMLQRVGQEIGLPSAVDRKRIIFERIELRQHAEPRGLGKGREY
jgi:hypothetical protein